MEGNKDHEDASRKYEDLARTQKEKLELRQKNLNVDRSSVDFSDKNSKLDLVNKFKNKLKDFVSKYDQIMKDLDKLNLTRYVLEVSKILCELSIPQKDIILFLRFTSRMHQEYEEFSQGLQGDLLKQIKQGAEGNDEQNKANRRRNLARFAFELYLIGLPVTFEKTFKQIKEILDDDNEDIFYANMNLAVTFVQNFNEEFIGTVARSKKKDYAQQPDLPKIEKLTELVSNEKKKIVLNYLKAYLERMIVHHKSYNKRLQELEDARKQALLNLGKVDEETESKYTELTKKYTTTFERIQIMCDHLDLDPPKQEDEDTIRFEGEQTSKRAAQKEDEPPKETDQFENEQEFAFYGNLIDLRDYVPDALLSKKFLHQHQSQQQSQAQAQVGASPAKEKEEGENEHAKEEKPEEKESEEHKMVETKDLKEANIHPEISVPSTEATPIGPKSYEELISRLEVCESRDFADDFAKDFCYINNAPNRKRLIKDICAYHKDYQILIPLYCRILATLNRYYRDVGEYLLEYLQKEYKYIKDKAEKERRLRIILYFCEATKFRLIPTNYIMDCLQECLNSPTGINIDVIILILERTGVFLYNNSSKNDRLRFEMQLTQVNNFRTTAHLPDYTLIQLENAYYICKPPERAEIKIKKHLTDLENYILYLLFERLEDNKVAVELAKLPFAESEDFLVKCFMKIVRKGRYGHMNRAAALVNYLGNYYPSFTVKIIDTVLEEVIVGFEENVFTERQKRISFIKFFGELYNYTAIEIDMIFKILYFTLEAGNDQTNLTYRHITDSKDDIFRISLICTLLETVAPHLKKKKYKNAVDKFLVFFQRYILTKSYIPINVEFHVLDVLDTLSPDLKKFKTYKEAHEACMKLSKIKEEEVEESKDFNELRVRLDEEKGLKSEEELERERRINISKQEKQFNAEFQELMQASIQENISSAETTKPVKLIKEKVEEDAADKDAPEISNKGTKKKIVLCLRQGNKLVSKNIYLNKQIDLAKKISKKEEEEKETREKAMEATKSLHDSDVKKSNLDSYEGYVSNSQIRVVPNKKQYK